MAKYIVAVRNARMTEVRDACNSKYLIIYSGSVPAAPSTALSGQTVLAVIPLAATSGTVTAGVLDFDVSAAEDTAANATGTPTFARIAANDGSDVQVQLTAGVGTGEVNCAASITLNEPVPLTAAAITEGNA